MREFKGTREKLKMFHLISYPLSVSKKIEVTMNFNERCGNLLSLKNLNRAWPDMKLILPRNHKEEDTDKGISSDHTHPDLIIQRLEERE